MEIGQGHLTETNKIKVMLPHWIDHNKKHIEEFVSWRNGAEKEGNSQVVALLNDAIVHLQEAGNSLTAALNELDEK